MKTLQVKMSSTENKMVPISAETLDGAARSSRQWIQDGAGALPSGFVKRFWLYKKCAGVAAFCSSSFSCSRVKRRGHSMEVGVYCVGVMRYFSAHSSSDTDSTALLYTVFCVQYCTILGVGSQGTFPCIYPPARIELHCLTSPLSLFVWKVSLFFSLSDWTFWPLVCKVMNQTWTDAWARHFYA